MSTPQLRTSPHRQVGGARIPPAGARGQLKNRRARRRGWTRCARTVVAGLGFLCALLTALPSTGAPYVRMSMGSLRPDVSYTVDSNVPPDLMQQGTSNPILHIVRDTFPVNKFGFLGELGVGFNADIGEDSFWGLEANGLLDFTQVQASVGLSNGGGARDRHLQHSRPFNGEVCLRLGAQLLEDTYIALRLGGAFGLHRISLGEFGVTHTINKWQIAPAPGLDLEREWGNLRLGLSYRFHIYPHHTQELTYDKTNGPFYTRVTRRPLYHAVMVTCSIVL